MTAALPREDADVETSSDGYAQRFAGPVGAWFLDVQLAATRELLRPFARARIVELGGGHGQLARPLMEDGHEVTVYGSDPSCAHRVPGVPFAHGDLRQTPYPDGAFDVAMAFRLLPHAHDWRAIVAELCRITARAVIVDYPTTRSLNAVAGSTFGLKKGVEKDTRPFRVFRDAEVADAFGANGFRVTGRIGQFAVPMAVHRALGSRGLSRAMEGLGLRHLLGSPVVLRAERHA